MINLRYIKSNINHFKKDKFSVFVCILSVIIGGFHTWQFKMRYLVNTKILQV